MDRLAPLLVSTVIAGLYAFVAWRFWRRPMRGDARAATVLFAVWWAALAALTFLRVVGRVAVEAGATGPGVARALVYVGLLLLCVALWALAGYLVYIFSGSMQWIALLAVAYGGVYLACAAYVESRGIRGLLDDGWRAVTEYEHAANGTVSYLLVAVILVPQLVGALAYASLLLRPLDRTVRWRVSLVSSAFTLWFGSALLASLAGISESPAWPRVADVIALGSTGMILAAYAPPAWARRRLGLRSMEEEGPG